LTARCTEAIRSIVFAQIFEGGLQADRPREDRRGERHAETGADHERSRLELRPAALAPDRLLGHVELARLERIGEERARLALACEVALEAERGRRFCAREQTRPEESFEQARGHQLERTADERHDVRVGGSRRRSDLERRIRTTEQILVADRAGRRRGLVSRSR
jgi:hypothetical protein